MAGGDKDWQVGDLALCVRGGPWDQNHVAPEFPVAGRVYLVDYVAIAEFNDGPFLALWLNNGPQNVDGPFWGAERFRKIRPHTPDAEDAETIALLTGTPARTPEPVA